MFFKVHIRPSVLTAQQLEIVGVPGGKRTLSTEAELVQRLSKVFGSMRFRSKEERIRFFKEQYEFFKNDRLGDQKMKAEERELWEWFEKIENGWDTDLKGQRPSLPEDEMLWDLLKERGKLCNRIENTGWRRIPNTNGMKIIQGSWNTWLEGTGFDRRISRKIELKGGPSQRSRQMNKYLEHEVKYLQKLVANGELHKFWRVSWRLMERSIAFRTAAFNYCFYGWYKYRSVNEVVRINLTANRIIKERWNKIDFMRTFIPKANGKLRPLGVPTCAWRLVLHMYSNFLGILLRRELASFNHAYLPKKGTLTCITEWVTKVLKAKWVFEFDIKGFFDNVSVEDTLNKLEERGLPSNMKEHWISLLESTPWNIDWKAGTYKGMLDDEGKPVPLTPMDRTLGERKTWQDELNTSMMSINSQLRNYQGPEPKEQFQVDMSRLKPDSLSWGWGPVPVKDEFSREVNMYFTSSKPQEPTRELNYFKGPNAALAKGLPQGAAISPVLSLLALVNWRRALLEQGIGLLMYADDGILYSDSKFTEFPPDGFEIEPTKSGWVKKGGRWVKETQKFLGVRYHHKTDLISGETRSGKTLEFGRTQLNVLELIRSVLPASWSSPPPTRLDALMRSGLKGQAVSRLYNGIWDKIEWPTKWHIGMKDDSWWCIFAGPKESLIARKKLQTTASSYACHWLGGLITAIINPSLLKHGEKWEVSENYGSPDDMQVPLRLQEKKDFKLEYPLNKGRMAMYLKYHVTKAEQHYVDHNCNWREWLEATIKYFKVKKERKHAKPTPQDIAESIPLNTESSTEPDITKESSNGSRPSNRQAGPTSGFPIIIKEQKSARRRRVLSESRALKRAIRQRRTVLEESKDLKRRIKAKNRTAAK